MSIVGSANEVLRKIGRNMMLFQKLEYLLKFIVANGKLSGYASELENIKVKQTASINKQTMGQLVGKYIENTNPSLEEISPIPEDITDAYFSFDFHVENNLIYYEAKKKALAQLVSERNELVHHLLPKFDPGSIESCKMMEESLDSQSEKIRFETNEIQAIAKALNDGRKAMADFLRSEESKKLF